MFHILNIIFNLFINFNMFIHCILIISSHCFLSLPSPTSTPSNVFFYFIIKRYIHLCLSLCTIVWIYSIGHRQLITDYMFKVQCLYISLSYQPTKNYNTVSSRNSDDKTKSHQNKKEIKKQLEDILINYFKPRCC